MTFPRLLATVLGVLAAILPVSLPKLRADDGPVAVAPARAASTPVPGPPRAPGDGAWERLPAPAGKGKRDDVFFTDARTGWYVCGQLGTSQHTVDGGQTWRAQVERPGTYFRCLSFLDARRSWRELPLVEDAKCPEFGVGFLDSETGWVGTSTTGFATADGGAHWQPVNLGRAANKVRVRRDDAGGAAEVYAVGVELWRRTVPGAPAVKP